MRRALTVLLLSLAVSESYGGETVMEYLESKDQLSRFVGWMRQCDEVMKHIEKGKGPYTIFVPKNAALKEFLAPGVAGLIEKDEDLIRRIVGYHIVTAGEFISPMDVPSEYAGMATTLYDGRKILLEQRGERVAINGEAEITQTNIGPEGQNAIIHVVNKVLSYPGWFPKETLLTLLRKNKDLRAFYVTVWENRDELGLTQPGPITWFIPTNKALARAGLGIDGTRLSELLPKDRDTIIRILKYHIVHGKYLTKQDLRVPGVAQTLDFHEGKSSVIAYQSDASGVIDLNNGEGKVETKKGAVQPALDGVYYMVDRLLLPPGLEVPDVNYSSTRVKAIQQAEAKAAVTPEPSVAPYTFKKEPKSHKGSPLVLLLLVFLAGLLLYRVLYPDAQVDRSAKKDDNKYGMSAAKPRPNYGLALALFLLFTVPLFSSMRWVLPHGLKVVSEDVSRMFFGSDSGVVHHAKLDFNFAASAKENDEKLDDMLKYLNKVMYKTRLVDYGLNRVDLIALSSPDDGKRAGVRPGHWNDIVSEARKRHPVNPEDLDPTPPPFDELSVRPSVKTGNRDKEIDDAHDIAKEFERDSRIEKKEDVMEGATVDTPPPTPKPAVVAAPIEDKKRIVLAYVKAFLKVKNNKKIRLIAIPSTGASTVECSFGSRHGAFSFRNEDQYKHVHFTKITHLDEAARLPSEFSRKGDYKDVAADAKVITVMVATRPMARVVRSFYKSAGKVNTPESDFKCNGRLRDLMRGQAKKFGLEDYVKLPIEARTMCEANNNLMVKSLAGVPFEQQVTEDHVTLAKQNLNKLDMLMIEEDLERKSMLGLMVLLGLPTGSYLSCSPYEDQADIDWSHRATDTIARDNFFDRELYSEAHHVFNTKYAGGFEQSLDASKITCTKPQSCFDENDRNGERKAKDPFDNVQLTMRRSTSKQGVMCATHCHMPSS